MSYSRFLSVISGRRLAFLVALCAIVAVVMLATLAMKPQYVAQAQVIVESRNPNNNGPGTASRLAAGADLLQSERVSIDVLRLLGLEHDPALRQKWQKATDGKGDFLAWASEQLLKKLDVKPARESGVLTITYTSEDPAMAAKIANAFVTAYLEISRQLREESVTQSSASYDPRTRRLKAALDSAEEKLTGYLRDNSIASTDDKLDVESLRLSELNTQLVTLQSAAANAAGRQRQASVNRSGMEEVLKDPVVASLSAEVAKQEAKLAELRSKAGDRHPAVAEQRNTLAEMKARLDAASSRASSSIAAESRIATDRMGAVQTALDQQRAKVLELRSKRAEAQRLQRDVELARRAYDDAVLRTNESTMDSGASRESVSLLKSATVPVKPAFPRPMVNLAAALVIGLLAGIAAAFWRERRDRRLRLEEDVFELLEQPLVGVLSNERPASPRLMLGSR